MNSRIALAVFVGSLAAQHAFAGSDFNGDGADDLAIGTPHAELVGIANMGSVHVLYGVPASGIATTGAQLFTLVNLAPVTDPVTLQSMAGAGVGYAVATGDFNGDGFDDLAIGAIGVKVGNAAGAGVVYVVPGSAIGLQPEKRKVLHQNAKGVKGKAQAEDAFGLSLACGNFNGDAYDDLAVGVLETVKGTNDAGSVAIFRGSKKGLGAKGNQLWSQASKGVVGDVGSHFFGMLLGTGDLDGNGRDELVIGSLFELDGNANFGVWTILKGTKKGLTGKNSMRVDLAQLGGESPTGSIGDCDCGDIDGDGFEELALSWPSATAGSTADAGILVVVPGSALGPQVADIQVLHQSSVGVDGTATAADAFSLSLVCADFNGDGFEDVACGNSLDDDAGAFGAGTVEVFFGSAAGLSNVGEQLIHQDTAGMDDACGASDDFGASVGAGDFDGNGAADLVVGVPGETVNGEPKAGALHVLPGILALGLSTGLSTFWHQDVAGVLGTATENARFGFQLAQSP